MQGIESFEVPESVLTAVCEQLWRQRITREEDVTYKRVRDVLKALRLRRMYEHCTQITCRITNRPLPKLSARTQEMTKLMFRACQEPFARHCSTIAPSRKNFVSYSYVLYQFLVLLGESDDILDAFQLLKGRDKRARMNDVFALICRDLDWEFIPCTV